MPNSSLPKDYVKKLLSHSTVPSSVASQALKVLVSNCTHKKEDLSRSEKALRREEKHLTAANKKVLDLQPAHEANQRQYAKDKDELAKVYQLKDAEFNGEVLRQTELMTVVEDSRQSHKRDQVDWDRADSKKRMAVQIQDAKITSDAETITAFLVGLGNPDVIFACPRSPRESGSTTMRYYLKTFVQMILVMLTNLSLISERELHTAVGLSSGNQIAKSMFERLVAYGICIVVKSGTTNKFMLSEDFIAKLEIKPRLNHARVDVDWSFLDEIGTPAAPASPPGASTSAASVSPN